MEAEERGEKPPSVSAGIGLIRCANCDVDLCYGRVWKYINSFAPDYIRNIADTALTSGHLV